MPPAILRCAATLAAILVLGVPALARHLRAPATGLRTVDFAKAPPDFSFDDGHGVERLGALVGKPVIVNFWATWCEPCRAELDAFARVRASYGDAVTILTISDEAPGVARAFLHERGLDLPVVEDPARAIFTAYSVTPIPVTLVLRPDGTVGYVSIGETSWPELREALAAPAMASSSPAPPSPSPT